MDCSTTGSINGLGDEWPDIQIPYLRQFLFYSTILILSMIILPKFSKIKYINILPNLKINFYYLFIFGFLQSFTLSQRPSPYVVQIPSSIASRVLINFD